jgi:deazaflavin-dependent oxidoreductase (nitroreductase family)
MIMTTKGRKSGLPRRTAIEYHTFKGRKYVMVAWPKADWYRNLLADPRLTIQTAAGTERVLARRLRDDKELAEVYEFVEQHPLMRKFWQQVLGLRLSREEFLATKDRFHLITFDPTDQPTPSALQADLKWVWLVVLISGVVGWLIGSRQR